MVPFLVNPGARFLKLTLTYRVRYVMLKSVFNRLRVVFVSANLPMRSTNLQKKGKFY